MVVWDFRGYGYFRFLDRDFLVDFFERDVKDVIDLMKVSFLGKRLGEGACLGLCLFILFCFLFLKE